MKILFLSISYNENKTDIYTDLVDALIAHNHSVTIVTSNSSNSFQKKYRQIGIKKIITGKVYLIQKGLSTLTIGHQFKAIIQKELLHEKFDLILYATPPITLNSVVKFCKKFFKAKTYLMLKDIFPQNAVDLSMMSKKNPIYWFFRKQEKSLYKISDYIGCMSQANIDYVLEHNSYISKDKVGLFYNSIKINTAQVISSNNEKVTTFIFGGNLGRPQNIPGLLEVIKGLNDFEQAKFIIVGSGSEEGYIKDYIQKNRPKNLDYKSYIQKKEYEVILSTSDVGVISLDPRFTIPNIPSKLPSYMSMAKPILAIIDQNTDLDALIKKADCGWTSFYCENNAVELIKSICSNKQMQINKGKNGLEFLKQNFDVNYNVKQLEKFMEE